MISDEEQQSWLDHRTASGWSPFTPAWSEPTMTDAQWQQYRAYEAAVHERWLTKAAKKGDTKQPLPAKAGDAAEPERSIFDAPTDLDEPPS